MAETSQQQKQRQGLSNSADIEEEASTMVDSQEFGEVSASSISPSIASDPYGCFPKRMGRILPTQESSRNMVDSILPVPYQHSRGNGSISNIKETMSSQTDSHQSGTGQRSSCTLPKQRGLQVEPYQSCNECNFLSGKETSLARVSYQPGRCSKCHCRFTIQDNSTGVGMVLGQDIVRVDLSSGTGSPGRPVCHREQPQASVLRCSQSRPSSSFHRCDVNRLEQMAKDLSVSTNKPVDESFTQTQIIQRSNSTCGTQLAEEQLVSSSTGVETPTQTDRQSKIDTSSANSDCVSFLKNSECPSFMDL
ncbi:uncharacterized protein [Macrobrachium rosenbergii]|uniref:uncharacterized protein n=1 Tax=Macrobrachium rosenbergii TaxID=79674 RepID=UPI0034D6F65D